MAAAGVRLVQRAERVTVVGGTEALGRLPALWSAFRVLRRQLRYRRPRVLVLIDFPEFNLRLARVARRLGVPVVYFVAPQLWAWRPGRVRTMARDVSRVLAIFPFEVGLYQEAGVPVEFVGHPVLDVLPALDRETARSGLATEGETLVGLLPGSRDAEVRRHLPVLLGAAHRIAARRPRARFALPVAHTIAVAGVAAAVRASGLPVKVLPGEAYRVMAAADLLLVASGTATLEAACYGTPMVVLYRLSAMSHAIARRLVRGVSHISLPNIVAGREIVRELIQGRSHAGRGRGSRARASRGRRGPGGPAGGPARGAGPARRGGRGAPRRPRGPARARWGDRSLSPVGARPVAHERRRPGRALATSGPAIALGRGMVRALAASLRLREFPSPRVEAIWRSGEPVIYTVWHGQILLLPLVYGRRHRIHALTSRSRDGEILSRFVQGFGIRVVRGSSSRGGARALLALARVIREEGENVLIVPDGPRGPRHVAQNGAVILARMTGVPMVPLAFGASPCRVLRSWDAFVVPHPFARAVIVFGDPIVVPRDADRGRHRGQAARARGRSPGDHRRGGPGGWRGRCTGSIASSWPSWRSATCRCSSCARCGARATRWRSGSGSASSASRRRPCPRALLGARGVGGRGDGGGAAGAGAGRPVADGRHRRVDRDGHRGARGAGAAARGRRRRSRFRWTFAEPSGGPSAGSSPAASSRSRRSCGPTSCGRSARRRCPRCSPTAGSPTAPTAATAWCVASSVGCSRTSPSSACSPRRTRAGSSASGRRPSASS